MNLGLAALITAIVSYLLGCMNGAITVSKLIYRDDVRRHGSGNAGLTNFFRTYGGKFAALVVLVDMGKAAAAVLFGVFMGRLALSVEMVETAKFFAALFCILGHMFPVTEKGKGGKGILCGGTLLLMLDWRVALVGWVLFVLCVALTRYISLGSVAATVSFPVMCAFVYDNIWIKVLSAIMAALVVWAHRENVKRLLKGTENKFSLRKKGDKA